MIRVSLGGEHDGEELGELCGEEAGTDLFNGGDLAEKRVHLFLVHPAGVAVIPVGDAGEGLGPVRRGGGAKAGAAPCPGLP